MRHRWVKISKADAAERTVEVRECTACESRIVLPIPNGMTRLAYYKQIGVTLTCDGTKRTEQVRRVMDS